HDVPAFGAAGDGIKVAVRCDLPADDLPVRTGVGGPEVPAAGVVPDVHGGVGTDLQLGGAAVDHARPVAVDAGGVVAGGLGWGTEDGLDLLDQPVLDTEALCNGEWGRGCHAVGKADGGVQVVEHGRLIALDEPPHGVEPADDVHDVVA